MNSVYYITAVVSLYVCLQLHSKQGVSGKGHHNQQDIADIKVTVAIISVCLLAHGLCMCPYM